MTDAPEFYLVAFTPTARRQLTGQLPEAVAAAARVHPRSLLDHPNRVTSARRDRSRGLGDHSSPVGR